MILGTQNLGGIGDEIQGCLDGIFPEPFVVEDHEFFNDGVDVQRKALGLLGLGKGEHFFKHVRQPFRFGQGHVQKAAPLVGGRDFRLHQFQGIHDPEQRIVQLVGNLGGEPAHGGQFFRLEQVLPGLGEFPLGLEPLPKIHKGKDHGGFPPPGIVDHPGGQMALHPLPGPLLKGEGIGFQGALFPVVRIPQQGHDPGHLLGRENLIHPTEVLHVLRIPTEKTGRPPVPQPDGAFHVRG